MARGISLHFAVSKPDPASCCEATELKSARGNATTMATIAKDKQFSVRGPFFDNAVTSTAVRDALACAARELRSGDMLLLTFARHGCDQPGINSSHEWRDQAWCLADGRFTDNQLDEALKAFCPGVRILVVSESCHSETIVGVPFEHKNTLAEHPEVAAAHRARARRVAAEWGVEECSDLVVIGPHSQNQIQASVIVLSACRDAWTAKEVAGATYFTPTLEEVLKSNQHATYCGFMQKVREKVMKKLDSQEPCFSFAGILSEEFARQRPFTI